MSVSSSFSKSVNSSLIDSDFKDNLKSFSEF